MKMFDGIHPFIVKLNSVIGIERIMFRRHIPEYFFMLRILNLIQKECFQVFEDLKLILLRYSSVRMKPFCISLLNNRNIGIK